MQRVVKSGEVEVDREIYAIPVAVHGWSDTCCSALDSVPSDLESGT